MILNVVGNLAEDIVRGKRGMTSLFERNCRNEG
jgi:hypothetical protein